MQEAHAVLEASASPGDPDTDDYEVVRGPDSDQTQVRQPQSLAG